MDLLLQAWGGGCYLFNKIFFALAEGRPAASKRTLRCIGWGLYIVGVPAWVIILAGKHNWIAAAIEAGGIPAMFLGLHNAWYGAKASNRTLDRFAATTTYAALLLGVAYSLYEYGGLTTLTQLLEVGVMIGFLIGSYLLARKNIYGWLFFVLMNGSMATRMLLQHKPLLTLQQLVSLGFVLYGFTIALKTSKRS